MIRKKLNNTTTITIPKYIVLNDACEAFCGFKFGHPNFSSDINEARELNNEQQFRHLQRMITNKIYKEFI